MARRARPAAMRSHKSGALRRTLADTLAWCGWNGAAVFLYRAAARSRPGDARAHFGLGEALAGSGEWHAASWAYQGAVSLRPRDPECVANLALALARAGRWNQAAEVLTRLAQLRPHEAEPRLLLAVALKRAGRPAESLVAFRAAAVRGEPRSGLYSFLGPNIVGVAAWDALVSSRQAAAEIKKPQRVAAAVGGLWTRRRRPEASGFAQSVDR